MKEMWGRISGQNFKDYLWPNVNTDLGRTTALYEGGLVALALAIIYGISSLLLFKNGASVPPGAEEFIDSGLYTNIQLILNLTCLLTAVFYIRSVAIKESRMSIIFLLIWVLFEFVSVFLGGVSIMLFIYGLLFLGSINAYRA